MTTTQSQAIVTTSVPERPLTQAAIKNLKEIVDGDLKDLHVAAMRMVELARRDQLAKVNEFHKDDTMVLAGLAERVNQLVGKHRLAIAQELHTLEEETGAAIHAQAVSIGMNTSLIKMPVADRKRAELAQAQASVINAINRVIERTTRQINRQILLQGVTGMAASSILNDMPTLEDMTEMIRKELRSEPQAFRVLFESGPESYQEFTDLDELVEVED